MSYVISFNEALFRVEVIHTGDLALTVLSQSIPTVKEICQARHCWKILSDIRNANYLISDSDEFAIAQHLTEAYPENTTFVILHTENQISIERSRLLRQTSALRGICLFFTSDEHEVNSLLSENPSLHQGLSKSSLSTITPTNNLK
ncbi:hypothetical protein [Pleionea sediminis]|uniref:hypothetical protein n=1 Tax=Pleionea sediminis TaxID=2569479 RepID=UPI0011866E7E|nr:hypothetical protein [Pleionea sediminis]